MKYGQKEQRTAKFPALMITENSTAFDDQIDESGKVDDPDRIRDVSAHLK